MVLVGTPAGEVHEGAEGEVRRRSRRKLGGLREGGRMIFEMLMGRPEGVIPPAKAMILQGFNESNASRRNPSFACRRTHCIGMIEKRETRRDV